jgi:diaminohydroxyphosphoribosylaminopyrimidine deaminase/5-amino-6-(5-phosphoribosylamino)uracil reductase
VIAKWAMTLDGKLATRTGASRWISNESSRRRVHELRGRMDAILIGSQTALADDPLLTARPPGPRTPARVVLDTQARLPATSQLARTVGEAPVIIVTGPDADAERCRKLADLGVQIWAAPSAGPAGGVDLRWVLAEMGRRQWTNLLVEGGARTLGALRDADLIDEVHCFIASKLAGGAGAPSPLGGLGLEEMPEAMSLIAPAIEILDGDVYVQGRVRRGDRVGAA